MNKTIFIYALLDFEHTYVIFLFAAIVVKDFPELDVTKESSK